MESIHAKCLAFKDVDGVVLICQKSKGHTSPQCLDTDEDVYFTPDHKPNAKKK